MSLSHQVILITGASAGIGAALAKMLAEQHPGVRLVLAARRFDQLEAIATQCRQAGAEVLILPVDMSQTEQVKELAQKVLAHYGRVDAVVNNAGYGQMGPVELIADEAALRQFQVNFFAPITLLRSIIPAMREQGSGRIINISSVAGRLAFPLGGVYSASKFALEALSDALRMELEPFNIQVSLIEPGPVRTEFFDVAKNLTTGLVQDPLQTPYRAAFEDIEELDQQVMQLAWSSEQVASVILQALSDRRPKPRYVAASGGNGFVSILEKVLPTRTVDRFWQRFYRIDRIMREWQSKAANRRKSIQ